MRLSSPAFAAFARVAEACGFMVLPKRAAKYWQEIALLRRLLEHLDVDAVIDVGANRGQYHDQLREWVEYRGLIVSVEPLPDLAARLRERARRHDPLWEVRECALGAVAGVAEINVMANDAFSSFFEPTADSGAPFQAANTVVRRQPVTVRTLADLLGEIGEAHGVRRPFVKLDTQGYDLEVLRGGLAALPRVAGIQTEIALQPLYAGMPTWVDTVRALTEYNFAISGFAPIAPATQFPRAVELNCFAVNSTFT
jgi:FkbM family methyltransferase